MKLIVGSAVTDKILSQVNPDKNMINQVWN
jgi:hypothetical protein